MHAKWGTADRVTVIPNCAPLDEIVPVDRKNDWAVEQQLHDKSTLLYAGTLGLKHKTRLIVRLARAARGFAEQEVALEGCADRFERVLESAYS